MSSIARAMFPSAVVGRSFVLSVLFLILVVALFFIPEIIHLQENLLNSNTKQEQTASVSSYRVAEEPVRGSASYEVKKNISALDKVLSLINSGYLESESKSARAAQESPRARMIVSAGAGDAGVAGNAEAGISWKTIHSSQVTKVLRKAKEDVRSLAKGLSADHYQSREALLNYQNGISALLSGGKGSVPVQQALSQIERLDLDVTRAFIREKVDRADYLRWSMISLGPVFENSRATRMKQDYLAPFNPRITLAKVRIGLSRPRMTQSGIVSGSSSVNVLGFIMGNDTQRIWLLRNGRRIKKVSVSRRMDDQGKRVFRFSLSPASGGIGIQAVDAMNNTVTKTYRFIPRALTFQRVSRGRKIFMPFINVSSNNFDLGDVDLRMDRYFRESITSESANSAKGAAEKYQLVAF